MKPWLIIGLAIITGLGLLVTAAMAALVAIGKARGVEETSIPGDSLMAEKTAGAAYTDAYQIQVPLRRFADLDALIRVAFQKGKLVARNEQEILCTDTAPGLRFYVSYSLRKEAAASVVTMSTSVHYTNPKGRIYFAIVRPFHHLLLPFAVSQMVQEREN